MKLKSFGCSLIFGTDLQDDGRNGIRATPSRLTWPALLAQHHGWDYTCYARPGSGNLQILERLLTQLADTEPAVYVVGWTWVDRFDYTTTDDRHEWRTIMPVDRSDLARTYYKDIHSGYRDKLTSLINIKLAIDTLTAHGHKFIMTYTDDSMFDPRWDTSPAVSELQRYCEPYMTRFNNKNFLDWSQAQGFEISLTWHPLEPAHQAGFELIRDYNLV